LFSQASFSSSEPEIAPNVGEFEFDEDPRILTNLVGIANAEIRAGMPVEVFFDDVTAEITLAKFKPRAA
jgi:uncharacterized OB-fold protein